MLTDNERYIYIPERDFAQRLDFYQYFIISTEIIV